MNTCSSNTEPELNPESPGSWRSEIESRLNSYRAKRKRNLSGQFSMRFDQDGQLAAPREPLCGVKTAGQDEDVSPESVPGEELLSGDPEPVAAVAAPPVEEAREEIPAEPQAATVPAPRPSVPFRRKIVMDANVIEFPRLFPAEPASSMLAEPVGSAPPRILDAPEIAEPLIDNPILEGLRLESLPCQGLEVRLEIPVQAAVLRQRAYAGVLDMLVVLAGGSLSLAIAHGISGSPEMSRPVVGTVAVLLGAFWWVYQYLFLVHGGCTPGMRIAGIRLRTFAGQLPTRRERRRRAFGLLLSCMSLALGFVWVFFDEDGLCWHDRISRTYDAEQKM